MSGHSKWKTIKHQKGTADQKRGAVFTKLSKAIIMAVKQGGGITDPAQNFKLRLAIDTAKVSNMPKDTIERAIEKGSGAGAGDLHEVTYEGFANGGVSVVVEAVTDNPTRTTSEVKNVFHKNGASFGNQGSTLYQFKKMGMIIVKKTKTFDELFEIAINSGAEDIVDIGEEAVLYTDVEDLGKVRDSLIASGLEVTVAEFTLEPIISIEVTDREVYDKIVAFLELLEDLDDVHKVYSNMSADF